MRDIYQHLDKNRIDNVISTSQSSKKRIFRSRG